MKYSVNELLDKMNYIHNNKYEYEFNDYINVNSKILIMCKIHGYFYQRVSDHLRGVDCKFCGIIKSVNKKRNKLNNLVEKSNNIHNNKFDYSLIDVHDSMHTKINIICFKHGIFQSTFHSHINKKRGCKKCYIDNKKDNREIFIKKSIITHGDRYDYSLVNYNNSKNKVEIICLNHGIFKQSPNYHILGQGCPKCKMSKGENVVLNYLKENNINYIYQKKFNGLVYKKNLFFDFYLPDYNLCIEYDGSQHFNIVDKWGGEFGLIERKIKDKIKNSYCYNNNIKLIRIKYDEDIVEKLYYLL